MTYGNRHILYDGDFDIGTYENNTLINLRILGPTPLAEIGATALIQLGTLSQPTHDLFGNIHTIENHRLSYGAYGSVCTNVPTPWQYQGKRAIGHLIYFGKRFYSPDEGRFPTPDPLGYVDAPNLYHYLLSSPLAHHDPWGLTAISLSPDSYRALVALGWAARVIAPFTGPVGVGIAVGTAAVYTGYKLYSHYKESQPPTSPVEVLPKESSNLTKKPNLPQNNNRPPKLGSSAAVLQQIIQDKTKDLQSNTNNRPASSAMSAKLLRNQLIAEEISGGHAYTKHVVERKEFSGLISNRAQLKELIEYVLNNPYTEQKNLKNNRIGFWNLSTRSVIVRNPAAADGGTIFQPDTGYSYFKERLK